MFSSKLFLVFGLIVLMAISFFVGRLSVPEHKLEVSVDWTPSLLESVSIKPEQRINPPIPVYPKVAIDAGIEGDCEVTFNVSERGLPEHIKAICSDAIFRASAEAAIAEALFAPKIVRGKASPRLGVTYPIEYRLGNVSVSKLVAE